MVVVLSPRFTILATLCALAAAPEFITSVDARAIASRRHEPSASVPIATSSSHNHKSPELAPAPVSQNKHTPVLPLPAAAASGSKLHSTSGPSEGMHAKNDKKYSKGGKQRRLATEEETWDPLDPLVQIGDLELGDGRDSSYSDTHQILPREPHHHHSHHEHKRGSSRIMGRHHYGDYDPVIIEGKDAHVHVERRRDHQRGISRIMGRHYRPEQDTVIVEGKDAHVHVHRERRSHDGIVIVNGHRHGHDVIIEDAHRNGGMHIIHMSKRDDDNDSTSGVPGTIDIMVLDSDAGQKIASLVMSASGNGTSNSTSNVTTASSDPSVNSFVLDASNSTQTQVYLVPSPPPAVSDMNSTVPLNGTGRPDVTLASGIKVTLQVPMFEPSEAIMKPYCATFDPNPPAPAPLTMEQCFDASMVSELDSTVHKSQTFAFDPNSGVVRPLWFAAEATNGSDPTQQVNSSTSSQSAFANTLDASSSGSDDAENTNATATITGSIPTGSETPQNVTLVFTPKVPAINAVEDSQVASFEPADNPGPSDPSSTDTTSMDSSTFASTNSAISTDSSVVSVSSTVSAVDTTMTAQSTAISSSSIAQPDSTDMPSLQATTTNTGNSATSTAATESGTGSATISSNTATSTDANGVAATTTDTSEASGMTGSVESEWMFQPAGRL